MWCIKVGMWPCAWPRVEEMHLMGIQKMVMWYRERMSMKSPMHNEDEWEMGMVVKQCA